MVFYFTVTKKEIAFLGVANVSAIAMLFGVMYNSYLVFLIFAIIYLGAIIFLSALPSSNWLAAFFVGLFFLIDLVSGIQGLLFVFTFGLPTILLFLTVKKNFKLRIKIAFQESVTPALNRFFLLSLLCFSVYVAVIVSSENTKQTIKNIIPKTVNVSGKEVDTSSYIDVVLDEKMKGFIDNLLQQKKEDIMLTCNNDQLCMEDVENNFSLDYSEMASEFFGSGDNTESSNADIVEQIFGQLEGQYKINASQIVALLLFLTISPLVFLFSYILAIFYGIIYSLLRMLRILNLSIKQVDKEVLV